MGTLLTSGDYSLNLLFWFYRYTVTWTDFIDGQTKPVYFSLLSIASDTSRSCHPEFNAPLCIDSDTEIRTDKEEYTRGTCIKNDTISFMEYEWMVNSDIEIIYVYGHTHIGSKTGITAQIRTTPNLFNEKAEELLCASRPTYGHSESVDASFIIKMDMCDFNSRPRHVPKGSTIRAFSEYNGIPASFEVDEDGDGNFDNIIRFGAPYDGAMAHLSVFYIFSDFEYSQISDVQQAGVNFFLELGSGYFNNYYPFIPALMFLSYLGAILVSIFYMKGNLTRLHKHSKYHNKPI